MDALGISIREVTSLEKIPFLPISFFKSAKVATTEFKEEEIFESSGTTGTSTSRHYVKDLSLYRRSFLTAFHQFYGDPRDWRILALLPGYWERGHSSLIMMADELILASTHPESGFYLNDWDALYRSLLHLEIARQPVLLLGVTFALLDFAEKHSMELHNTTVMETGGMKGRREELTREAVHHELKSRLGVSTVHSEYGMTELLSQAYSSEAGIFRCPPWMRILIREENDPLSIRALPQGQKPLSGLINIIDLANLYACSFIATDDLGRLHANSQFEVMGRRDNSDIRGCSLLLTESYGNR